jgi:hypothetical protein
MLTRNWYWILAAFVVIGVGSFQILRPKEPLETIKIYAISRFGLEKILGFDF